MQTQKNLYSDRKAAGYFGYTSTPVRRLPWPMKPVTKCFLNNEQCQHELFYVIPLGDAAKYPTILQGARWRQF